MTRKHGSLIRVCQRSIGRSCQNKRLSSCAPGRPNPLWMVSGRRGQRMRPAPHTRPAGFGGFRVSISVLLRYAFDDQHTSPQLPCTGSERRSLISGSANLGDLLAETTAPWCCFRLKRLGHREHYLGRGEASCNWDNFESTMKMGYVYEQPSEGSGGSAEVKRR